MRALLLLTASLCLSLGCAEPEDLPSAIPGAIDDAAQEAAPATEEPISGLACQQGLGTLATGCDCTESHCGQNSPVIDGVYFSRLSLAVGTSNNQGFITVGYANSEANARAGIYYGPGELVQGTSFNLPVNHFIVLRRGINTYLVKLAQKSATPSDGQPYWAHPVGYIPWYRFEYTTPEKLDTCGRNGRCYEDVCRSKPTDTAGWDTLNAFVFEGNIYDQVSIDVETSADGPGNTTWYNIACAGSLPAKMLATRRVAIDNYNPPLGEQKAFANMWSGNYCGDGKTFTKAGWPLRIRDANAANTSGSIAVTHPASFVAGAFASVDAVWSSKGAVCLDTPRLDMAYPAPAPAHESPPIPFATWRDAIVAHCASLGRALPRCTPGGGAGVLPVGWMVAGPVISVNP